MTTLEMQHEALSRARDCKGKANLYTVYSAFQERGIALDDIAPGVNVLTFNAWKALGRSVRKGEKGVQLLTWVPCASKPKGEVYDMTPEGYTGKASYMRPKTAYVFHESQTVLSV